MLVGKQLLDKARSLSDRSEKEIALGCGYVGPSGRVLQKSFCRALVEAKAEEQGWTLPKSSGHSGGARGRQAEFRTRVHGNGNLLIGHAYTRRLGLEPGQEFKIELHRDSGAIWLLPLEQNVAEREQDGSDQVHP
jgi:bifunctional DNA-binding transcriptional regulator/antitoxin component of YhaV-PrlF toxin-antitoxin module|tara:strand:+ start:549 stop:953 length:405 start_codon:yes stop_codon:yes gene_type:complete